MRFGFIPSEGGRLFEQSLREICHAEELGFDSVWLEEHHGVKDHYWPSPLLCLAGYATRTSKLLLGTDVVVLPFYHPVRAAEDAAMLDVISSRLPARPRRVRALPELGDRPGPGRAGDQCRYR